ncbi:NAD-dependent epimerase/dehydratase family protein [Streptomyces sp. NBC_00370]|uniref:NAD-dependent epimerase/dehydratase family protein n=1 Tax=Streptomyces sp. NBC_00370 TaxID=2975728 RepID=UPI002E26C372
MRIFLAGATGVIGSRLLPVLLADGHDVTALTRRTSDAEALRSKGAEAAVADVYDAEAITRTVRNASPEVVMHQLTDLSGGSSEANAAMRKIGTANLANAALSAGARRMVAQSIAWAYQGGEGPADERTPLDLTAEGPRSTTVRAVATLEETARELPEWVVLRYGVLYGPGTWYAPGALMAEQALAGELVADGDVSSFLHVDDAVAAAVAALEWPSGAVNVCDDEPAAGHDWIPAFCAAVGAPQPEHATGAGPRHDWARGASNRHARENLGWTPRHRSWREEFGAATDGS